MTKVKICGITNYNDAAFCITCGASFLGFVFYDKSKRFISPEKAKQIVDKIPDKIKKVGVFVDQPVLDVLKIAELCNLDYLQFHGNESPKYLTDFEGFGIIKAFRVDKKVSVAALNRYKADYFLFDSFSKGVFGGTGKTFDWDFLSILKEIEVPFFVSGGLTAENVAGLIRKVRPFCVDVSSGVESAPGEKDHELVKEFIREVQNS